MRRSATGVPTGDFIEDKNAILPIDAAIQSNLRETATRVLAPLTPREELILRMRFGIGMNKPAGRRQGAAKAEAPEPLKGVLRSDRLVHNALRSRSRAKAFEK
jgi:hypothetical protein